MIKQSLRNIEIFSIIIFLLFCLSCDSLQFKKIHKPSEEEIEAIIQFKRLCDNIPPGISARELIKKLENEPDFCKELTERMCLVFELRNKYAYCLHVSIINFIDNEFISVYERQVGECKFKHKDSESIYEFSYYVLCLRWLVDKEEEIMLKKINST